MKDKAAVLERALSFGINLRTDIHGAVGITLDEATSREDVQTLFALLAGDNHGLDIDALDAAVSKNSQSIRPPCCAGSDPDPSGIQSLSQRNRDDALHASLGA